MLFLLEGFILFFNVKSCLAEMTRFQFRFSQSSSTVPSNVRNILMRTCSQCVMNSSCVVFSVTVDTGDVEMFDGTWFNNELYETGKIYGEMRKTCYDYTPAKSAPVRVPIRGGLRVNSRAEITYIPAVNWNRCTTVLRCDDSHHFYGMDLRNQNIAHSKKIVNYNMDGTGNWGPEEHAQPWNAWPFVDGVPFTFNFNITSSAVQIDLLDGTGPYEYIYLSRSVSLSCVVTIDIANQCSVQSLSIMH